MACHTVVQSARQPGSHTMYTEKHVKNIRSCHLKERRIFGRCSPDLKSSLPLKCKVVIQPEAANSSIRPMNGLSGTKLLPLALTPTPQ